MRKLPALLLTVLIALAALAGPARASDTYQPDGPPIRSWSWKPEGPPIRPW